MGKYWDSGIVVTVRKRDNRGRDLSDVKMLLKEGKKSGVYLMDTTEKGNPIIKNFNPASATVFRKGTTAKSPVGRGILGWAIAGPVGGVIGAIDGMGRQDAWYLNIQDVSGYSLNFLLQNKSDGEKMAKRIRHHIK